VNKHRFSWLRDWRIILLAICCAVAGFMAAAVLFGAPWHLPPAWGDIPTWLAFIAAAVAGSVALTQLSHQQRQLREEAARNLQRDELLSFQLTEAKEWMNAFRRQQAELVILTGVPSFNVEANGDGKARWMGRCVVENGSARPIRDVIVRMLINGNLILPTELLIRGISGSAFGMLWGRPMKESLTWALASIFTS